MKTIDNQTDGGSEATPGSYLTGFALAIALTVIPFALVLAGSAFPHAAVLSGIALAGVAQVLVHLHYFLHLNASTGSRWNLLAIVFTTLVLVILAGGSLWIMANLHHHMSPT
jgi:cytochrome o ubiquinol oxidase operon protein cyoD